MEILLNNLGMLSVTVITAFVTWFFSRKKQNVDILSVEIDNAQKLLKYYREMVESLGSELEKAICELNVARQHNKVLELKIEELIDELKKYKQLNGKSIT